MNWIKRKSVEKPEKSNVSPIHPSAEGQLLDQKKQEALGKSRDEQSLARAIGDRNRWFLMCCLLAVGTIWCANGWRVAENRYADNVQVSYVKLDPSGGYTVEFYNENRDVEFFQATVDAKIWEWVERRYSKLKESIRFDYGFVYVFMSPELQQEFMNEYKADEVAAELQTCPQCDQIIVKPRVIQHLGDFKYVSARTKKDQRIYNTTVYATQKTKNHSGSLIGTPENVIVTLTWRIKTLSQIQSERKNLNQNPVGIEIIRYDLKTDTNTLPEQSS